MKNFNLRSIGLATALGLGSIALIGCTTTTKDSQATPANGPKWKKATAVA